MSDPTGIPALAAYLRQRGVRPDGDATADVCVWDAMLALLAERDGLRAENAALRGERAAMLEALRRTT